MLDNINEEVNDYSADYIITNSISSTLPSKWLLPDICPTSDLISTTHLLRNIDQAQKPIKINFNAGAVSMQEQGYLGSYPRTVWHNPDGIANIISINNAVQHYRLTMDINESNCIHVN